MSSKAWCFRKDERTTLHMSPILIFWSSTRIVREDKDAEREGGEHLYISLPLSASDTHTMSRWHFDFGNSM
jgi:hypothetical protein